MIAQLPTDIETLVTQKEKWIEKYEKTYCGNFDYVIESNFSIDIEPNLAIDIVREYRDSIQFLAIFYMNSNKPWFHNKFNDFFKKYSRVLVYIGKKNENPELSETSDNTRKIFKHYGRILM